MTQRHWTPPYGEFAPRLLIDIFDALDLLCTKPELPDKELDHRCFGHILEDKYFDWFAGINPHIRKNLDSLSEPSRLERLTKSAFAEAQETDLYGQTKGVFLPSPLHILFETLTVPAEPQSRAYSLVTCRSILFEYLRVLPERSIKPSSSSVGPIDLPTNRNREPVMNGWTTFAPADVVDAIADFRKYTSHRDNIPYPPTQSSRRFNPAKLFVAHFLAMKGVLRLRFGTKRKEVVEDRSDKLDLRKQYCALHHLAPVDAKISYEFRLSVKHDDIPDAAELNNEIWGIPIPLLGFETILEGGLKRSSEGGVVISTSGPAGSGKTSFGLALAGALSALGTITYFLTIEERSADLKNRLRSLLPNYLNHLSIFRHEIDDWFFVEEFSSSERTLKELRTLTLSTLETTIRQFQRGTVLPAPCPLLVVIDGVTALGINKAPGQPELHDFVKKCRDLGALVVLISGEDTDLLVRLEYLADMVISLKHMLAESVEEEPFRVLQLLKTRLQLSRPGSHLLHLSGEEGFRVSPQLPSQLEKRHKLARHLPDRDLLINALNPAEKRFLDLFHGSQVLLHGHGSSGKAGLGLKILLTQPILNPRRATSEHKLFKTLQERRRRVLVVSFLYPETYYIQLATRLGQSSEGPTPAIECLAFFPGFLRPEDLFEKIVRQIEGAAAEGEPFTGILLDGLHNVFLQFPTIQDSKMIWPSVYDLVSRYRMTTVTTFTTFQIEGAKNLAEALEEMHLRGHLPFLHALLQASDFYLLVEPVAKSTNHSFVRAKSVLEPQGRRGKGEEVDHVIWNRNTLRISAPPASTILGKTRETQHAST